MMGCIAITTLCILVNTVLGGDIVQELTDAGATSLVDYVSVAGLAELLSGPGPYTVFAPDNSAFASLAPDTLQGSAVRTNVYLQSKFYDGFVTVNGKRVKKADIPADNGVIHMVNCVIYPLPTGNIAEVVTGDERFSTLLAAVAATELTDTLASGGPFTLFAPTNDAFAKIPTEALDALLADKDALSKVLLRHVVPGTLFYNGITWDILGTAGGVEDDMIATQRFRAGVLKVVSAVNGTRVSGRAVAADILATNGVIHAIDTVI